jgi:Flp pilus assembly protein TadG
MRALRSKLRQSSKGQVMIEMALAIIIFCLFLMFLVMISFYLYFQHTFLTAARDGARFAATEPKLASANATERSEGIDDVKDHVRNFVQTTTGMVLSNGEITVTGPTGTVGNREVQVTIVHTYDSPFHPSEMLSGDAAVTAESVESFEINATAVMFYEE